MNIPESIIEQSNRTCTVTVEGPEVLLALFAMDRIRQDLEHDALSFPDITATIDQLKACLLLTASVDNTENGIYPKAIYEQVEATGTPVDARFLAIGLEEILPELDSEYAEHLARQMIQQIEDAGVEYQ